jgi:small-conductance mechanosensitive channel
MNILLSIISHRVFQSLITLIVLVIIGMILSAYFSKNIESKHKRRNIKYRVSYLMIFIYAILMTRIWISGIYHFFTIISVATAGLVIANKESFMNMVGALIINWRHLFSEGDRISFANYTGYVTKIGVLYFTLNETSQNSLSRPSGRTFRIPNGLVITNPVVNYSQNLNILEASFSLIITHDSDLNLAHTLLLDTVKLVLNQYFKNRNEYHSNYIIKRNQFAQTLLESDVSVMINLIYDEPASVELKACFYAYSKDHCEIRNQITQNILEALKTKPTITLGKRVSS